MKRPWVYRSKFALQMRGFWVFFGIVSIAWGVTDNWREILDRVRENISQQVAKSTNYTCVEVVDRTSFRSSLGLLPGCTHESKPPVRTKIMHDRLRLDIAVSQGKEIFAWHGQSRFSGSSTIDDVVRGGTVSSGEFIGFLANIFLHSGVRFDYTGEAVVNGLRMYSFNYTVPVSSSGYHVGTKRGKPAVPFHGSFSVRGSDFQLGSLSVIADAIPENSQICSAETEMTYQLAKISGQNALIPSLFDLRLEDVNRRYTVCRTEYSQCHAFVAESRLRFDVADSPASGGSSEPAGEERLPAGTLLHIALRTPIDDETAYTGDPVEGILLDPVKVKATGTVIPRKSVVNGVITTLENFDEPEHHYLLSVQFERLTWGRTTFVFRAPPQPSKLQAKKLTDIYGGFLPADIQEIYDDGVFVFVSRHLHIDQRFSGYWLTQTVSGARAGSSDLGAR